MNVCRGPQGRNSRPSWRPKRSWLQFRLRTLLIEFRQKMIDTEACIPEMKYGESDHVCYQTSQRLVRAIRTVEATEGSVEIPTGSAWLITGRSNTWAYSKALRISWLFMTA